MTEKRAYAVVRGHGSLIGLRFEPEAVVALASFKDGDKVEIRLRAPGEWTAPNSHETAGVFLARLAAYATREKMDLTAGDLLALAEHLRAPLAATPEGPPKELPLINACRRYSEAWVKMDEAEIASAAAALFLAARLAVCGKGLAATPEGQETPRGDPRNHLFGCAYKYKPSRGVRVCDCGAYSPTPMAGQEAPSALPREVFCEWTGGHGPHPHPESKNCINPRPAPGASSDEPRAAPLAAPAEPEMVVCDQFGGYSPPHERTPSCVNPRPAQPRAPTPAEGLGKGEAVAESQDIRAERDAAEAILASIRKEFATEECPMCSTPLGEQEDVDEECASMHYAIGQAIENHRAACRRVEAEPGKAEGQQADNSTKGGE